jgi:hypothetical protein
MIRAILEEVLAEGQGWVAWKRSQVRIKEGTRHNSSARTAISFTNAKDQPEILHIPLPSISPIVDNVRGTWPKCAYTSMEPTATKQLALLVRHQVSAQAERYTLHSTYRPTTSTCLGRDAAGFSSWVRGLTLMDQPWDMRNLEFHCRNRRHWVSWAENGAACDWHANIMIGESVLIGVDCHWSALGPK